MARGKTATTTTTRPRGRKLQKGSVVEPVKTVETVVEPVVETVVEPVVEPPTKSTGRSRGSRRNKKTVEVVVEIPVTETPVVETPAVETPLTATTETGQQPDLHETLNTRMTELSSAMVVMMGQMRTMQTSLRQLNRDYNRVLREHNKQVSQLQKQNQKQHGKRRGGSGKPRKPAGFALPVSLSPEMATFLGVSSDTVMGRNVVSSRVCQYVKTNNLYDQSNHRIVLTDETLSKLFNVSLNTPINFFGSKSENGNLQTYLKPHCIALQKEQGLEAYERLQQSESQTTTL